MSLLNSLRAPTIVSISLVGAIVLLQSFAHAQTGNKEQIAKGQYIFAVRRRVRLPHRAEEEAERQARALFRSHSATVYSTNITQDKETGLGDWTDQQIHDAIDERRCAATAAEFCRSCPSKNIPAWRGRI